MSQSKKKPDAETRPIVTIVGGMPERHIADYIERMLEAASLTGPFEVRIPKKIKGSGFHHGADCQRIEYNAVRLTVQSSDNGTRYLCYLRSPEMKPKQIFNQFMSVFDGGHFDAEALPARSRRAAESKAAAAEAVPQEPAPAAGSAPSPAPSISFAGAADDEEVVAMVLMAIRYKHGMDGFSASSFLEAIQNEYAPTATRFQTGQLLRRIVDNGYLVSEGKVPNKVYRFAAKGLELFAQYDRSVAESAAKALNIADASEMAERVSELEAKVRKRSAIAQELSELNAAIACKEGCIEDLKAQLKAEDVALAKLREQALAVHKSLEDPDLAQALAKYDELQLVLKRKA